MTRSAVGLLLLGAAFAACIATASAACDQSTGVSLPGCATCERMTQQEIDARAKKWQDMRSKWVEKAKAMNIAVPQREHKAGAAGKEWPGKDYKCTACETTGNYELKNGRCGCVAGYGIVLQKPAEGQKRQRPTLDCSAQCPEGYASGPKAPKLWGRKKSATDGAPAPGTGSTAAAPTGTPGRHLLGAHHGFHSVCVKCPSGKASDDRTECVDA